MKCLNLSLFVLLCSCVGLTHSEDDVTMPWDGDLPDTKCNVRSVERANENQLADILDELVNTTFFRLIQIDVNSNLCPFWRNQEDVDEDKCEHRIESETSSLPFEKVEETEPACALRSASDEDAFPFSIPRTPMTDDIDRTLTEVEAIQASRIQHLSDDPSEPGFWLDLLSNVWSNSTSDYINLQLNPERWTGYNGSDVWSAMYKENCFSRLLGSEQDEDKLCYEERVMYRLLSGMHTATNVHINLKYFPPRRGVRDAWAPNPKGFAAQYAGKSQYIQNMHFAFVVLLRAAQKATPMLYNYTSPILEDDQIAKTLLRRLLDSQIMHSCSPVFDAFDESLLFNDEFHNITTLKKQFKGIFQNISSVIDCVTCEKCKMHAKVTVLGLGWALKTLLLPEHMLMESLGQKSEIVAFVNTLHKFSEAIRGANMLSKMYIDADVVEKKIEESLSAAATSSSSSTVNIRSNDIIVDDFNVDRAIKMISDGSKKKILSRQNEDRLIDLAMNMNTRLFSLARHYADRPNQFLRHAVRNLDQMEMNIISTAASVMVRHELGSKENPVDAVVVGSGLSGLAAALSVLDRGGTVAVVEKMGFMGGNSAKASSGLNGLDEIRAKEMSDSEDQFLNDMLKSGHCVNDDDGIREECKHANALVQGSGEALRWVRDRVGMPLDKVGQLGGHSVPRTYRPGHGITGAELIYTLSKRLKEYEKRDISPVRVLFKTRVLSVETKEDDADDNVKRVVSVHCEPVKQKKKKKKKKIQLEETKKKPFNLYGHNIVLATGGFGYDFDGSESLISSLRPDLSSFATTNGPWSTGDGQKMAIELGAKTIDMSSVQVHPTGFVDPKHPEAKQKTLCAELLRGVGGVLLTSEGKRFANELGTRDYIAKRMSEEASGKKKLHFYIMLNSNSAAEADKHVPLYVAKGLLKRHESLEDASKSMNVTLNVLVSTLSKYNKAAIQGFDEFGKTDFAHTPWPVSSSEATPVYLGIVTPVVHYCMGGLETDENGLVMSKKNGLPVAQGLYAVGELMGGVHGSNRLGGNALTECAVFGRAVGMNLPIKQSNKLVEDDNTAVTKEKTTTSKLRKITQEELESHQSEDDVWVAIHGLVYDFTDFAEDHPGGGESIWNVGGKDGTKNFDTVHTVSMLEEFEPIGTYI